MLATLNVQRTYHFIIIIIEYLLPISVYRVLFTIFALSKSEFYQIGLQLSLSGCCHFEYKVHFTISSYSEQASDTETTICIHRYLHKSQLFKHMNNPFLERIQKKFHNRRKTTHLTLNTLHSK